MKNRVNVTRCNRCKHYEQKDNSNVGYCYYWDFEQGMSPNLVNFDDFCSNADPLDFIKQKKEITVNEIKDFIYSEHGAMPVCILETIEKNNVKLAEKLTKEIKEEFSKKKLDMLVRELYNIAINQR